MAELLFRQSHNGYVCMTHHLLIAFLGLFVLVSPVLAQVSKPIVQRSIEIVKRLDVPKIDGSPSLNNVNWQFAPGGNRFAGISREHGVVIWNLQPLKQLGQFKAIELAGEQGGKLGPSSMKFDPQGTLHIKTRNTGPEGLERYARIDASDPSQLSLVLPGTQGRGPIFESSGRFALLVKPLDTQAWGLGPTNVDPKGNFRPTDAADVVLYDLQNRWQVCDFYDRLTWEDFDRRPRPLSLGSWFISSVDINYHEASDKEPGIVACDTKTGKRYFMPQPIRTRMYHQLDPAGRWLYVETYYPKRLFFAERREAYFFALPLNDADFFPTEPTAGYPLAVGWPPKPLSKNVFMPRRPYIVTADGLVVTMQEPGKLSFLRAPELKEVLSVDLPGIIGVHKYHISANGRWLVVLTNKMKQYRIDLKKPSEPPIEIIVDLFTIIDISDDGEHWLIDTSSGQTSLIRIAP